jgi:protein-histidine N-methyltransferase
MKLPDTLQADRVIMPSISYNMYKRTIADVKFQIARQDTLDTEQTPMIEMAGNTDLIKGIYEGGFKTWECSIDLVEFMHSKLDDSMLSNKKILEVREIVQVSII